MIRGRCGDTSGRPYFEGRIIIPRLNIQGNISFLLDTGADGTVLMPLDAIRLGVDYQQLTDVDESIGIGGVSRDFMERAFVLFSDPGVRVHGYEIRLRITTVSPEIMDLPSLLGRDIVDRWRLTYDKPADELVAEVSSADVSLEIPGSELS